MRVSLRAARLTAPVMALALLASACAGSVQDDDTDTAAAAEEDTEAADDGDGAAAEAGSIVVSGSSTVEPITNLVAEAYAADNPEVGFDVSGPGTGDGFAAFCNGETDISDASRAIKDEEAATCEENGIDYVELKIAIDGLSVLTSPDNEAVECVSYGDLYALLGPESTGFASWSDADDLAAEIDGTTAPYPDAPLQVTAPGEESGTYDSFVELVFEDIAEERGQDAQARPDYTASPNDNVIVDGIAGSPTSLGWVGYAFYEENTDTLKALQVDGGEGCVGPDEQTIASGEYPLSRPLFIYVSSNRVAENPALAPFVDFYVSEAGNQAVADAGYVQLPADEWAAAGEAWSNR
ncbi:MAG TPA: phosphate ABC transporter substrate-binding protein PstS family protein [Egicoccus sp.]|nr:phosphate ABC transporter substrate-binding protein PstS family protein [Egicoccus sp.]HSK23382.1 phosphate ABC transporter substrate-binding protein PstS family protein [Egicoccus sp.]